MPVGWVAKFKSYPLRLRIGFAPVWMLLSRAMQNVRSVLPPPFPGPLAPKDALPKIGVILLFDIQNTIKSTEKHA